MLPALLFMLGIGAVCGIVLSLASKVFYVYEDPRIAQVENNLAGANCGGCGYAGCSAAAEAIVSGKEEPSLCIINSKEGVEAVSMIMGKDAGSAEQPMSYNMCDGGNRAADKYHYASNWQAFTQSPRPIQPTPQTRLPPNTTAMALHEEIPM